ncbi:FG-GAP repeat domain-containing protein [Glycomyces terrestris]|uniref:VCBS repeat-containing protein n=1 Tax=Glycomyces terrestris TaxID=2493553 RepID=A0A426US82_9ACTN|nr:VCBS repeat-containing protein [Glycomyces terrestris]RRR96110.1 VCBS repeat-containing protein [Glycomyces terrestris]
MHPPPGRRRRLTAAAAAGAAAALLTAPAAGAATVASEPTGGPDRASFAVVDGSDSRSLPAAANAYDYDGDRLQDLYTVRKSDGALLFHAGNGDGTFAAAVAKGTGWGGFDVVMAGDLTGDGVPDLLGRDARTGTLFTYPGNGSGGLGARISAGTGWNALGAFTSGGDFDDDGDLDLYAVRRPGDVLRFYPGNGDGTFAAPWGVDLNQVPDQVWDEAAALGTIGSVTGEGGPDLLLYTSDGGLHLLRTESSTILDYEHSVSREPQDRQRFRQITSVGDQTSDGAADLVATDSRTGELVMFASDPVYGFTIEPVAGGAGEAGSYRLPATDLDRTYDYDLTGTADIMARRTGGTDMAFYPGTGTGFGPSAPLNIYFGWEDLIESAGDIDGDGYADLLARSTGTGELKVLPGIGSPGYLELQSPVVQVGTGWHRMSAIVSGHDHDGDGAIDIVAREASTGVLWLYPGDGDGTVGTRVKIGTGWNGMREITAAGDLDHDGHADVLAVRNSDECLYLYRGNGDGTLRSAVRVGCGWAGLDALTATGDFGNDGHGDLLARRTSDGGLFLYRGDGTGGFTAAVPVGTGWNAMDLIV